MAISTEKLARDFRLDGLEFRPSLRKVVAPEGSVTVEAHSTDVLVLLAERAGEVVSRQELLDAVWGEQFVTEEVLTHAIWDLRRALGDDPKSPRFIQTLPKRGYRLIAKVSWLERGVGETARPLRILGVRWLWLVAALMAMALGIAGWHLRSSSTPAGPPLRAVPLTSLPGMEVWPALSPSGDRVAFVWNGGGDGRFHLYVKLVSGGDAVQLTDYPADDYSPAWSPDGQEIAFLRTVKGEIGGQSDVFTIPALGGSERRLGSISTSDDYDRGWSPGLDWSPDGHYLAVVDRAENEPFGIFLLSIETGEKRRLTAPPTDRAYGDKQPAFSPDGRTLAFARGGSSVYLQSLEGGESEPLGVEVQRLILDLDWVPDGSAIVFSSATEAEATSDLRRIPIAGGEPTRLPYGVMAETFSIARQGARLVYDQRSWFNRDLWRIDGPSAAERGPPTRLTSASRADWGAEFSPDGTRIAFASERGGANNIWLCDSDGSECRQLTHMRRAWSPSWSPDGRSILFRGAQGGEVGLYVMGIEDRLARRLPLETSLSGPARWSHDGRWIYFSSGQSGGAPRVWKVPAEGGQPIQITQEAGYRPRESAEGEFLYYADRPHDDRECAIRRVPVSGGQEVPVTGEQKIDCGSWTLWRSNLAYLSRDGEKSHLELIDLDTQQVTRLFSFEHPRVGGVTVSPDGRWVVVSVPPPATSDLMQVEGFR